jgi:hypothetical protein
LHPDSSRHSCCCSAIVDILGVTNGFVDFSAVPFEKNSVAGGRAVTGFPAVEGVLAVASVPADPSVHILAGGFTY